MRHCLSQQQILSAFLLMAQMALSGWPKNLPWCFQWSYSGFNNGVIKSSISTSIIYYIVNNWLMFSFFLCLPGASFLGAVTQILNLILHLTTPFIEWMFCMLFTFNIQLTLVKLQITDYYQWTCLFRYQPFFPITEYLHQSAW